MNQYRMNLVACLLLLLAGPSSAALQRYPHTRKTDYPVPFYAELDVSETQYLFDELLSRIAACGLQLEWRKRGEFSGNRQQIQKLRGPILLVATGGPTSEEADYFRNIPAGQRIVLIHPSDEGVSQTDTSVYTAGVSPVFRNYYHSGMGNSSMQYLRQEAATGPMPKVLWMPLGLANLKSLPAALKYPFRDRRYLWSWAGSTGNKPERAEMLNALASDSRSAEIMSWGVLKQFGIYAGRPGGHAEAVNAWEYSMLMYQTQFVPVPAGISAEQFRVWEALEAGKVNPYRPRSTSSTATLDRLQSEEQNLFRFQANFY